MYLEQISMVPKMFEQLNVDCNMNIKQDKEETSKKKKKKKKKRQEPVYKFQSPSHELQCQKTYCPTCAPNGLKPASTSAQCDQSCLSTWRNFASLAIQNLPTEEVYQIARTRRLIWAYIFEGTFSCVRLGWCATQGSHVMVCGKNARGKNAICKNARGKNAIGKNARGFLVKMP